MPSIKVAAGVSEAAVLHLRSLIVRLRLANHEFRTAEKKLDELSGALNAKAASEQVDGKNDVAILTSMPGIGRTTLAILLAEASGPISRRDYGALRTLSGVAPVTKRSGKSHVVSMRYAAHPRLRNAVFYWTRSAIQNNLEIHDRYAALRKRGHSYGRAIRGVSDRLLSLACVLLRHQTVFDPEHGKRKMA
jgi:transposase